MTGKAKNVSDATSTMFIHIKFIDKSGDILGRVVCSARDLEPGQTEGMSSCQTAHMPSSPRSWQRLALKASPSESPPPHYRQTTHCRPLPPAGPEKTEPVARSACAALTTRTLAGVSAPRAIDHFRMPMATEQFTYRPPS